jgi:hypothetical protein
MRERVSVYNQIFYRILEYNKSADNENRNLYEKDDLPVLQSIFQTSALHKETLSEI